jgi:hypothetical protein
MSIANGLRVAGSVLLISMAGCASIASGTSEPISVNTEPPGAYCVLEREGAVVGQVFAPGTATVSKGKTDLTVHCNKVGYVETDVVCRSGSNGWVWGNALIPFVGWAGLIADASTGAFNDYDDVVTVVMLPTSSEEAPYVVATSWRQDQGARGCVCATTLRIGTSMIIRAPARERAARTRNDCEVFILVHIRSSGRLWASS